jgi:hypothetical protein
MRDRRVGGTSASEQRQASAPTPGKATREDAPLPGMFEGAAPAWRTIELACLLALAGCAGTSTPKPPPAAMATCSDLACLQANEGKVIDVEGTFAFPPDANRKGTAQYKLALADGTVVVLKRDARLTPALDGKSIVVRGKVYASPERIPDEYGIIQSTANPYLVELYAVTAR